MHEIPKIFHFIWVGGTELPLDLKRYILGWKWLHTDWKTYVWRDEDVAKLGLLNRKSYDDATVMAQKCDILCMELLFRFGGVYLETDLEPRKNIDPILKGVTLCAAKEDAYISGAIMGATPGHPAIIELIQAIPDSIESNKDMPINHQTGPVFRTPIFRKHNITLFPAEWFCPYLWDEKHRAEENFPEAYGVHRWRGSWLNNA